MRMGVGLEHPQFPSTILWMGIPPAEQVVDEQEKNGLQDR